MKHIKHVLFALAFFVVLSLAARVSAATIPVFDWAAAYTGSSLGVAGGYSQLYGAALHPQNGSLYVASFFSGTQDFDPSSSGTNSIASVGGDDAFVSKFSADGSYEWTKTWGESANDSADRVAVDVNGNVYVTGAFRNTIDFDPGAGTSYATSSGGTDVYINKLDTDGNFEWAVKWGGTGNESSPPSLATSAAGDVYVLGYFTGTLDFDPSAGTAYATSSGSYDAYLSKFSSDGTFQWVKRWGGTGFDIAPGMVIDENGYLYFTGYFTGTTDLDPGAGTSAATSAGSYDGYIMKLDSDGVFVWAKTWGGTGDEIPNEIALDSSGNPFSYGYFTGTTDLDPTAGTQSVTSAGSSDLFISKFDPSGSLVWAKGWGGTGGDGLPMLYFSGDRPIAIGSFNGTVDFDPGAGTESRTSTGGSDIYIVLFDSDGVFDRVYILGGTSDDYPDRTVPGVSPDGNRFVVTGYYKSAGVDFDPSGDTESYSAGGTAQFYASFDLVAPAITVTESDSAVSEAGETGDYSVVLSAPPTGDVVVTVTPDAQVSVSPSTLTFASTTWDTPQTVTVSAVDDEDSEGEQTAVITHTVSSDDTAFDGLTASSVSIVVTDNDNTSSSSYSPSARRISPSVQEATPPIVAEDILAELPADRTEAIAVVKQHLVNLIRELITVLQQELKELKDNES